MEKLTQNELNDLATIRQQKSRLNAKPLSSLLRRLVTDRNYAAEQSAQLTKEIWDQAVGAELSSRTRTGNINRGILYVEALDGVTVQELHFQKLAILKALREKLPSAKIRDLRVRVVSA